MIDSHYLQDIQANILKGHGRRHAWHLFIQFNSGIHPQEIQKWISQFSERISSVKSELEANQEFKSGLEIGAINNNYDRKTVTCFFLTKDGYHKLGYSGDQLPSDPSFRMGMKNGLVNGNISDPPSHQWEPYFQERIDAMILIANKYEEVLAKQHIELSISLMKSKIGSVLFVEKGVALTVNQSRPNDRRYIEHFGFRDGISNPIFKFDIHDNHVEGNEEIVLEEDSFGGYGSYLVFRKLEQNVHIFNQKVEELATDLGLDKEIVEAQIIGRFKDGTPLEISSKSGQGLSMEPENNFDFREDIKGQRCPFHAHIRKVRPRIDTIKLENGEDFTPEDKLIVRRGITYGRRAADLSDEPDEGVGLLFMCYQKSIMNQFEFIQKEWCNNTNFLSPTLFGERVTGIDPIIGNKRAGIQTQNWNTTWLDPISSISRNLQSLTHRAKNFFNGKDDVHNRRSFRDVVTLKGGEYFYAPPISFLRNSKSPITTRATGMSVGSPLGPREVRPVPPAYSSYSSFNKQLIRTRNSNYFR